LKFGGIDAESREGSNHFDMGALLFCALIPGEFESASPVTDGFACRFWLILTI
jgi:hypothetical protein